jgi:hypothetical protein
MQTEYTNLVELTDLQKKVMVYIQDWARNKKTLVPQKAVVKQMKLEGMKEATILNILNVLQTNYYIRRACTGAQNRTFYVQLRTI